MGERCTKPPRVLEQLRLQALRSRPGTFGVICCTATSAVHWLRLLCRTAGISRDSLHKRRETGGKQNKWRKKRK